MRSKFHFLLYCLLGVLLLTTQAQVSKRTEIRRSLPFMDTEAEIVLYEKSIPRAEQAIEVAFKEILYLSYLFDHRLKGSELYEINQTAGQGAKQISRTTYTFLKRMTQFAITSKGGFNTTQNLADMAKIGLDPTTVEVTLPSTETTLNVLNAAQGFAIDRAVQALKTQGITSGLVNIGQDVFCFGEEPCLITIQNPQTGRALTEVPIQNQGLSLAGEEAGPARDPRAHTASTQAIRTVVIAPQAELANYLATALLILGPTEGKLLAKLYQAEALWLFPNTPPNPHIERTPSFPLP